MRVDQELLAYVAKRNGLLLELKTEVSNRRGAKMLELRAGERRFGLKVATDGSASVVREAAVLKELRDFTRVYVDSGPYQRRAWLLLNWVAGQSVYRYVRQLRDTEPDAKPKLKELFAAMFEKVAELHALGYLHGDLQPDHFRWADGSVQLLDFALAHRTDDNRGYQGALVHFSAPEVCQQQLSGSSPVRYDEQAELYSLASVIFFLYTGQLSADYGNGGMISLEEKRKRVAQGRRNTLADVGAEPWDDLEHTLEKCLAADRRERYSDVAEAALALRHVTA